MLSALPKKNIKLAHSLLCAWAELTNLDLRTVDKRLDTILGSLKGFDFSCGKDGIVMTFDWKHLIKRIATLLRRTLGVSILGTPTSPTTTLAALLRITGETEEALRAVFWPDDRMNVPLATRFLRLVTQLSEESASELKLNPTELQQLRAFRLLAGTVSDFYETFADPMASLTQRLTSLSSF